METVASVGMLAKEAERFRRREDGDGGSSGAPEPSSQRKAPRGCAPGAVTSASAERRRARDNRAPSAIGASVGHGGSTRSSPRAQGCVVDPTWLHRRPNVQWTKSGMERPLVPAGERFAVAGNGFLRFRKGVVFGMLQS